MTNLSQITLATDNVFGDDSAATELATVTGNVTAGFNATLTIAVDPSGEETGGGAAPPGGGNGTPPSGEPGGPGGPRRAVLRPQSDLTPLPLLADRYAPRA